MSLRPSERVEVRRNRYKVAVDAEEGRRRREDNMVEIRKNRREESLLKRRREGLQAQVPVPASGVEKKLESLPAMVSGVYSDDNNLQLEATTQFRKLLPEPKSKRRAPQRERRPRRPASPPPRDPFAGARRWRRRRVRSVRGREMGNCQAAEAAAVVIQHPGGKVERLYGPATAGEVMRGNPGHYVALVVLRVAGVGDKHESAAAAGGARITKVKLLKPKDALLLGQVYRLITSQEVAKAIQARRQDKTRRCEESLGDDHRRRRQPSGHAGGEAQGQPAADQERKRAEKADRQQQHRGGSGGGGRGRQWRPSLRSITESAS